MYRKNLQIFILVLLIVGSSLVGDNMTICLEGFVLGDKQGEVVN